MNFAGQTLRFVNFLLDTSIYFALLWIFFIVFIDVIPQEDVKWISILAFFLYYFVFESMKGQTPAKMITGTRLVSISGDQNHFLLRIGCRTLMRFIPLDILSYLLYKRGLHDWISKTAIIKV